MFSKQRLMSAPNSSSGSHVVATTFSQRTFLHESEDLDDAQYDETDASYKGVSGSFGSFVPASNDTSI